MDSKTFTLLFYERLQLFTPLLILMLLLHITTLLPCINMWLFRYHAWWQDQGSLIRQLLVISFQDSHFLLFPSTNTVQRKQWQKFHIWMGLLLIYAHAAATTTFRCTKCILSPRNFCHVAATPQHGLPCYFITYLQKKSVILERQYHHLPKHLQIKKNGLLPRKLYTSSVYKLYAQYNILWK